MWCGIEWREVLVYGNKVRFDIKGVKLDWESDNDVDWCVKIFMIMVGEVRMFSEGRMLLSDEGFVLVRLV